MPGVKVVFPFEVSKNTKYYDSKKACFLYIKVVHIAEWVKKIERTPRCLWKLAFTRDIKMSIK
jgi:hypothetical protein